MSISPLPGFLLILLTLFRYSSGNSVTCGRVYTYNVSSQVASEPRAVQSEKINREQRTFTNSCLVVQFELELSTTIDNIAVSAQVKAFKSGNVIF